MLGLVSRPVSATCAVSDRWSAKILNDGGAIRYALSASEDVPRGKPRRPARQVSTAAPWPPPMAVARLRSANLLLATVSTRGTSPRAIPLRPLLPGGLGLRQIRRSGSAGPADRCARPVAGTGGELSRERLGVMFAGPFR